MLPTIAPFGVRTFLRGMSFDVSSRGGFPPLEHKPKRPAIIAPATHLSILYAAVGQRNPHPADDNAVHLAVTTARWSISVVCRPTSYRDSRRPILPIVSGFHFFRPARDCLPSTLPAWVRP